MIDKVFLEVLVNYAPNLVSLQVDRFTTGLKTGGSGFFQAIHDAVQIRKSRGRQSKLTDVSTNYSLRKPVQLRMGSVVPGFSLDKYNKAGYRFARIINQDIVRLEDEHALKIQEDAKVASTRRGKREHDLRRKFAVFLGHPSTQRTCEGKVVP